MQMARPELIAEKLTADSSRTENLDSTPQPAAAIAEPQQATPPCPHFGLCGGCQLQHLAYSVQLERKAAQLRTALSGLALPELQLPEIQWHASPPLAYRNRIRLTLATVDGRLHAGYLGRTARDDEDAVIPTEAAHEVSGEVEGPPHFDRMVKDAGCPTSGLSDVGLEDPVVIHSSGVNFVPITQCPIAAPLLWRAAEAFLALASNSAWLRDPNLLPDQLELFTTADESKLQITLYLRPAPKKSAQKNPPAKLSADFAALCESLHALVPELAGAGIALLPPSTRSRRIEQPRPGPAWGAPGLNYSLPQLARASLEPGTPNLEPDLTYWVPRGAFFQVNRFLLPELVALVTSVASSAAAASPDNVLAWDLYAGVGLFSRALASHIAPRSFTHVTAVEIAEPAATALAQTKLLNLRAVKATTLNFLRTAVLQRDRPSAIVLDPPRTGLGDEVCALLARVAAPTVVYVSCSPTALAADLADLAASGYSLSQLHLFDLFPQTAHIETVAILTRTS
jgi:23S rRNA (uracil1939-C5)-methyltransferase